MSKGAFKNFKFKNIDFKNKVVMAPESSNSANSDGIAQEFHFNHYGSKALNGVGAVIIERTATTKVGRKTDKDLGIWSDKHVKGLKKIADAVREKDIVVGIQLYNSGIENKKVNDFSTKEIKGIIKSFKAAAKRASKAGIDFIEINGELITNFLSKSQNKRADIYGGSFVNRARLVSEIIKSVRKIWSKEKVLAIRISTELCQSDEEKQDLIKLISMFQEDGVDLVNLSTESDLSIESRTLSKIKSKIVERELPVVEGGLINVATDNDEIVNTRFGLAFLGQAILRDSYWILNEVKSLVSNSTKVKTMM